MSGSINPLQTLPRTMTAERFKEKLEEQQAAKLEQEKKNISQGGKRLNELNWPKHWTRSQKRACVAATKRALKRGYKPDSEAFEDYMKTEGFEKG